MQRIYYAFALRVVLSQFMAKCLLFVASVYGLSVMVHVSSIIENIQRVQVGSLTTYIFNAFTHTDVFTLLFVGLTFFTLLSFRFNVKLLRFGGRSMQTT
jgi:hypothetical protein